MTFTVSAVLETRFASPLVGKLTLTVAGLNFKSEVLAIVKIDPPAGVVLDSAPLKFNGSTMTLVESFSPAPVATT